MTAVAAIVCMPPPLKGEGRAEGPGRGHRATPTRLAVLADLPLPGGGKGEQ